MSKPSILISILNWNTAKLTLACVTSILNVRAATPGTIKIVVIDNGSDAADIAELAERLRDTDVCLHREPLNLGFTGGHNIAIQMAQQQNFDFIWLVNSDSLAEQGTLLSLLAVMDGDEQCGAVSPLIMKMHDPATADDCGGFHDWQRRETIRAHSEPRYRELMAKFPSNAWIPGTAILFRVSALRETGPLDNRLFAYYDDDDICARLAAAGWICRFDYHSKIRHVVVHDITDRKPYFFYLMQRNYLIFWYSNTPTKFRKFLWLKLLSQSFYEINRLYLKNDIKQAEARMLGVGDFIERRYGRPDLGRSIPLWMRLARRLAQLQQHRALHR
ncbi:MAG: glycosyltransferase family 2 protein [Glaciimonas sp.]|nr:glycosyltransferase family 2 protein [Glaciimonas sp.]